LDVAKKIDRVGFGYIFRVARLLLICIPKITIWVHFVGPWIEKGWNIFWPLGIFNDHLVCILRPFGIVFGPLIIFPLCTNNLATLLHIEFRESGGHQGDPSFTAINSMARETGASSSSLFSH
jgi:hypothetical protein